jgi:hypothetical protein
MSHVTSLARALDATSTCEAIAGNTTVQQQQQQHEQQQLGIANLDPP